MRRWSIIGLRVAAAAALAVSGYCLLWVWSSLDLAYIPCNGTFSLFAESFRCRQPHVAAILCLAFTVIATLLWLATRRRRSR